MDEEIFTAGELEASLGRVSIYVRPDGLASAGSYLGKATYPDALARDLLRDMNAHREPEYEGDAHYMDADGAVFQYDADDRKWWAAGDSWSIAFGMPARPLRKMEPVG